MNIIDRLVKYRLRKMRNGRKPTKILLNWKHMLEIEVWIKSRDLKMDFFSTIVGYQILGMILINKGE